MTERLQNILNEINNETRTNILDLNLSKEELLAKDKYGVSFIEYLLAKKIPLYCVKDKIKNNTEIAYLLYKYNELMLYSYKIDEKMLFSYVNGKRLIDYIIEKNKIRSNYVTKLFLRIFLSSLLLLLLILGNNYAVKNDKISFGKKTIEKNTNFIKIANIFNSIFGNFIPIDGGNDVLVDATTLYGSINYVEGINYIDNNSFEGVYNFEAGIIIKKTKDKDGLYTITVLSQDNICYTYIGLTTCNFNLYSYVSKKTIIGNGLQDQNGNYQFKLIIEKEGVKYDIRDIT